MPGGNHVLVRLEFPPLAVATDARAHAHRVRPGVRLGHPDPDQAFAGGDARQETLTLLVVAEVRDRARRAVQVQLTEHCGRQADGAELLEDQRGLQVPQSEPAVLLWNRYPRESLLRKDREVLLRVLLVLVPPGRARLELAVGDLRCERAQLLLCLVQGDIHRRPPKDIARGRWKAC